jgi:hypothetical protein
MDSTSTTSLISGFFIFIFLVQSTPNVSHGTSTTFRFAIPLTAHQLTCLSLICLCRDQLLPEEENLIEEELEVYGIDWQGLRDDGVLQSQAQNNPRSEGSSSWVGYTGPPPDLSEVIVQPPQGTLTADEISHLYDSCSPLLGSAEDADIISLWNHALTHVCVLYPNIF